MRKIVVIIAIFMLIVACARRIPPIPPDAQFPASLGAVKGIVKEGRFFITWRIPTKEQDRNTQQHVQKKIWKQC